MSLTEEIHTLAELPAVVSRVFGSKTALTVAERSITYKELNDRSNRIAAGLLRVGIAPADRIAVIGTDSIESVALLFGAAKAKAVLVNINSRLAAEEIAYILRDADPRLLFVDEELMKLVPEIAARTPWLPQIATIASASELSDSREDTAVGLAYDPDDVVVQIYTSGTTGHPKGVQLPSRSLFAIAKEMAAAGDGWIGWTDRSVSLLFVPTFHIGGLWWLVRGLAMGSSNIVLKRFGPKAILRAIPHYRVTKTCMVPAMLQVLLGEPGCKDTDFSSLETIVYGGSPISPALLKRGMEVFQCDFCQIYGMTETGNMAVCLRPEDHRAEGDRKYRAAGTPLPGVKVTVRDAKGNEASRGTIGEIAIHSPAHMTGYWKLPEATRGTLVDGWVMTGDAGYQDEEGYVYVCDRIKDMIISAGENIYPAEIENVIRTHPQVADVAVIGVPDEMWGEAVKAVVVSKPSGTVSPGDIIRYARSHLAEFKIPKTVDVIQDLPRNATGKVLKAKLREPYWAGRSRQVN